MGIAPLKGTSLYTSTSMSAFNVNRPFPEFDNITQAGVNLGHMWYNGLQINFNQRFSHGLVFTASYVRSRQIEQWGWMNQYLLIPQRSPYGFDHPNVFKLSGAYDLPFGKSRTFKMGGSRIADLFLGGWQIAPTLAIQNGERADLPGGAVRLWEEPELQVVVDRGGGNAGPLHQLVHRESVAFRHGNPRRIFP